jgi:hypothetical protein
LASSSSSRQQGRLVVGRELQATQPTWIQLGADIDGEAAGDYSGESVSLSSDGTVLAVGAKYNNGNGLGSGHVRVFKYANSKWTQLGADINGEAVDDYFGSSVSLSSDGTVLAVGAPSNDGNGSDSGHVRVFKYADDSKWTQRGADINGEAADDFFGYRVDLSSDGTVLAVGAKWNDGNGSDGGHARVYQFADNAWTKMGTDIDGEAAGDYSGTSVSLSSDGTVLAVGAYHNNGMNGVESGHVRVYKHANSQWTQLGADIDGEGAYDNSGESVSLSSDGTVLAVGAPYNDGNGSTNRGHVRVYQLSNNSWTQLGSDIDGEAFCDRSGSLVSLSSDGTVLAVGALHNGNHWNGHVRVYKYTNSKWTQMGADIDGEADYDLSGWSISLSSDGTMLAVGAIWNDGNGSNNSGHVRIYQYTTSITTPSTPKPTNKPTKNPTNKPTNPTAKPTNIPTKKPTNKPTTRKPTNKPTTRKPTSKPTKKPN